MAKGKKKKPKYQLERERLKTRGKFYMMIASLSFPATALLKIIGWLLKRFLN